MIKMFFKSKFEWFTSVFDFYHVLKQGKKLDDKLAALILRAKLNHAKRNEQNWAKQYGREHLRAKLELLFKKGTTLKVIFHMQYTD